MPAGSETEFVVLLDDAGRPTGTAEKALVHHGSTPLHLAFSCYLEDSDGSVLLTRRAVSKRTWPGVWTNSVCGHPAPDEDLEEAVRRRAEQELGIRIADLTVRLPDFRYRAVDAHGVVENEVCPVWTGRVLGELRPDPAEVAEWRWASWASVHALVDAAPWALSPWAVAQLAGLRELREPAVLAGG